MRALLLAASTILMAAALPTSASAQPQDRAWCLDYNGVNGGFTRCVFSSFEQCNASRVGEGGNCYRNPGYREAVQPYEPKRSSRR